MGLAKDSNISLEKLIKVGNGGLITWIPEDFNKAINDARNQFSDSIGAPRIPDVKWEDIGGLDLVKDEIMDTIDMPLKHPELFSNGLKKRSGYCSMVHQVLVRLYLLRLLLLTFR